eukprot:CAMPEP_0181293900 /NCGR_PEP_ID=MMETSP1101-20121128/3309_1 /TAXON_ID=46948 /ORGANISM="Rhodomonas abbreviata, Strain Caron Lab Isolate" /LENGTH=186 /DNA_ID=CAMNT_0023398513 /DNA_START=34 /DNA_END=594 /DNA_ORIENTATION=+
MLTHAIVFALLGSAAAELTYPVKVKSDTTCVCTTVPCPVVGANYLTEGGGALGTYTYIAQGEDGETPVVSTVSVTITEADLDMGTDTTSCTQEYSRSMDDDGTEDCDAGHILAHRLGGPGNQPINIFPQDLSINRGIYSTFEENIYYCFTKYDASSASLSWSFTYSDKTRTKPDSVTYTAKYSGGT